MTWGLYGGLYLAELGWYTEGTLTGWSWAIGNLALVDLSVPEVL